MERTEFVAVSSKDKRWKEIRDTEERLFQQHPNSQPGAIMFVSGRMYVKDRYKWTYTPVTDNSEEE